MRRSTLALAVAWLLLLTRPAEAYLDPGTGSYVFQMAAAALVSVAFVVRTYWHRIRAFFSRRGPAAPPRPGDER